MADWTSSMQQTFEFYIVDPATWGDMSKVDIIKSGTITRDSDSETLGSASFTTTDVLDECYIRVYLVVFQNGVRERFPLGTFLCQSPGEKYDGKTTDISVQAYTPLIELKEKMPPLGYALNKTRAILSAASNLTEANVRAPIVRTKNSSKLADDFVSNLNDTWLTFLKDLLANAEYEFALDEMGRILFVPYKSLYAMQPVWTFDDGNSSILQPSVTIDRDLYSMPNVVEVVYSKGEQTLFARMVNDDPDSPISTVNRGREIVYRETDPDIADGLTQGQINAYANRLLSEKSLLEYTVSYTHGYCPVRLGDCVMLDYKRAGLNHVKAIVTRQSISLESGCQVDETAVYSTSLWNGNS